MSADLPVRSPHPTGERWTQSAGLPDLRGSELTELLNAVRRSMSADTATVLLLDRNRTALEPAATSGLDRTLRGARRIPIGSGFAGRIAQTRQPYVISEVTPANVLNPVLHHHGVRSLLGVPLMAGSELLGVLHVGSLRHHEFGDAEVEALTKIASELGAELRRRFADEEHTAALVLQRSLLPSAPAEIAGLTLAARYIPAEGDLGGDWYDVFPLEGNRVGVVMGDVVGHGLQAAVVMGRLRSSLRAYALDHPDPGEVLHRLDRKISHFERGAFATVIYGVAEYPFEHWLFSSAGHVAPFVAAPEQPVRQTAVPADPLLGLDASVARRTTHVQLPREASICLFTDGLVERRPTAETMNDDDMQLSIDRLTHAFSWQDDPEIACMRIVADVVGDHIAEDDMALLIARRTD